MDVTKIPFIKHNGIEYHDGTLQLLPTFKVKNHLQGIHAAAQFALAESASGLHLQKEFPQYEGEVVVVLHSSTVKYKSPAMTKVVAKATWGDDAKKKFVQQLERKGRAAVEIDVSVVDEESVETMQGVFRWFVQKLHVS